MALQNFEPTSQVNSRIKPLPEVPGHAVNELRAMAQGIQAWFDGSSELNVSASQPRRRHKSKASRTKRGQ